MFSSGGDRGGGGGGVYNEKSGKKPGNIHYLHSHNGSACFRLLIATQQIVY